MITSLVPGKIEQVLVRPGETVAAGQELARVTSTELDSLQLSLLQTRARSALARKLVDQKAALEQDGVIAGKSLLEMQRLTLAEKSQPWRLLGRKLELLGLDKTAIQQVEQNGPPLSQVSITTPLGGIITHADVRIGQLIDSATDHLYHVVQPSTLWIVGEVLESEVRYLQTGQPVEATFTMPARRVVSGAD